jgi:hypothetical protein
MLTGCVTLECGCLAQPGSAGVARVRVGKGSAVAVHPAASDVAAAGHCIVKAGTGGTPQCSGQHLKGCAFCRARAGPANRPRPSPAVSRPGPGPFAASSYLSSLFVYVWSVVVGHCGMSIMILCRSLYFSSSSSLWAGCSQHCSVPRRTG